MCEQNIYSMMEVMVEVMEVMVVEVSDIGCRLWRVVSVVSAERWWLLVATGGQHNNRLKLLSAPLSVSLHCREKSE